MDKPLSDSTIPMKLALIQKRFEELMRDDEPGPDGLRLEDDTDGSSQPSGRDYFIGR